MSTPPASPSASREHLLHYLYEAAELEHNLLCTYLYAAFSLRTGQSEGLSARESEAVARWRSAIIRVAVDEMGHLTAVCNIMAALGAAPRFGRGNFPLDPGMLPAGIVVKLAPFSESTLQHFIHLERPEGAADLDGSGFVPELRYVRGAAKRHLTPMAVDYETVGAFYAALSSQLQQFVSQVGEAAAFSGDPALQLSRAEIDLAGAEPVLCLKTALAAFRAIVEQGEGASVEASGSHYARFAAIKAEYEALKRENPAFEPAVPCAVNPVLRRPLRAEGRIWLEDERAVATVDLANAAYGLMLRLLAYAYVLPRTSPEKQLVVDLSMGLMHAATPLGERAARLPAGPSHPGCNAGMSFTALRDAAPLLPGPSAAHFFRERLNELRDAALQLDRSGDERTAAALRLFSALAQRGERGFAPSPPLQREPLVAAPPVAAPPAVSAPVVAPRPAAQALAGAKVASTAAVQQPTSALPSEPGVEVVPGQRLTVLFEAKKCIHARFCVTGAPKVFLANVEGPWIHPDAMPVASLVEIAHACPSGAIRYQRHDGEPEEAAPPVNLMAIREAGPYAFRGALHIEGEPVGYRATLCRCGASKRKPYCDGSHHEVGFTASGEPPTQGSEMLAVRDGPLAIEPQLDGPLALRGNLEITSGTGRVVSRTTSARLCRCGASDKKPFCDGSHARVGFKST